MIVELKKTNKQIRMDKSGDEIVTHICTMKGSNDVVTLTITLKSESLETLNQIIPQNVGESRNIKFELLPVPK